MASQRASRFKAELAQLTSNPPPGIEIRLDDKENDVIFADISGPEGCPFEKGTFTVQVSLSERYPFTPPIARFITPIYHPNVDTTGRICLSGLKPKPSGTWNCSLNIAVILSAIRLLLNEPNLGDPLMADIAAEYQNNFNDFRVKAQAKTRQFAMKGRQSSQDQDTQPIEAAATPLTTSVEQKTKISTRGEPQEEENIRTEKVTRNVFKRQPSFQGKRSKPKEIIVSEPDPEPEVINLAHSDDDFEVPCRPSRSKKAKLRM